MHFFFNRFQTWYIASSAYHNNLVGNTKAFVEFYVHSRLRSDQSHCHDRERDIPDLDFYTVGRMTYDKQRQTCFTLYPMSYCSYEQKRTSSNAMKQDEQNGTHLTFASHGSTPAVVLTISDPCETRSRHLSQIVINTGIPK